MDKAVLFDFHNTLATCDGWLELEIQTLPALTIEELVRRGSLSQSECRRRGEAVARFKALRQEVRLSGIELSAIEGTRQVLVSMGFDLPVVEVEAVVAALEEALLPEVEVVEGAGEVLAALKGEGYRLGVVSSAGYPRFVEMSLEVLGLRSFFTAVVTSAGEGIYKSDPELFVRAVRYLDVEPRQAVHVGDHPVYDVKSAKAAGLSAIWFSAHSERTAHLHSTPWEETVRVGEGADAVVEVLSDVPQAVRLLLSRA